MRQCSFINASSTREVIDLGTTEAINIIRGLAARLREGDEILVSG